MTTKEPSSSVSTSKKHPLRDVAYRAVPLALLLSAGLAAAISECTGATDESKSTAPPAFDDSLRDVEESVAAILSTILAQESKKDATCWSSVRMIEGFSLGRQLTPAAEVARIEVTRALLKRVWQRASQRTAGPGALVSKAAIEAATPSEVKEAQDAMDIAAAKGSGTQVLGQAAQGMTDQQKTTENWRALLSLLFTEAQSPVGLRRLEPDAQTALAQASTAMTSLVLRRAAEFTEEAKRDEVSLEDIQKAYQALVGDWFGKESQPTPKSKQDLSGVAADSTGVDDRGFAVMREATIRNAAGKLEALSKYNKLKSALTFKEAGELAPYLSRVVGFPVTPEAAEQISQDLRSFARLFVAPHGPQRSDTFSDSTTGMSEDPGPKRLVSLAHVFNSVQDLFPTRRSPNADAEVLMTRNVIPPGGGKSVIEERRVSLVAPSLDAVRDTGIHWLTLTEVLKDEPHVALDPFAAELLTETLSEYAYFLLMGSVKGAVAMRQPAVTGDVVKQLPWKFPKGRFFPIEDPHAASEQGAEQAPNPDVIPEFLEREVPESVSAQAASLYTKDRNGFQAFMGSGFAVGDFNDDGKADLFVAADGGNRLLMNQGNFRLTDVTEEWGTLGLTNTSRHPIFVDVNGDGKLDLFVTQSHAPSKLFLQGDGKFVDHTSTSGIKTGTAAHNAHFFDYDQDGDLDLFVGHYGKSNGDVAVPTLDGRNGYENQLYQNDGNGKFLDVSKKAGVASTGWNLASAALDIDGDGYLDFWLANDFGRDQVFHNQKDGTFVDVAEALRTDDRGSGMNVSVTDINRDGRPDVFISMIEMFSKTLRFVLPRGDTAFEVDDRVLASSYYISGMKLFTADSTKDPKITLPFSFTDSSRKHIDTGRKGWAWGAAFFDYDLDGDEDMYLANGWIERSAFFEQNNQFMVNSDSRLVTFGPPATVPQKAESSDAASKVPQSALSYPGSSRAVGAVDLNGDGRMDVLVLDYQGGLRIFENKSAAKGQALRVVLQGKNKNVRGIGAKVEVYVEGADAMTRFVDAGANYLSQAPPEPFFGLPQGKTVAKVAVTWANGKKTVVESPKIDAGQIVIREE